MPANKMPEMPEAVMHRHWDSERGRWFVHEEVPTEVCEALYTAAQMRAMYLAGIEAAKACVPDETFCDEQYLGGASSSRLAGFGMCRDQTLTNLSALEQGVGE